MVAAGQTSVRGTGKQGRVCVYAEQRYRDQATEDGSVGANEYSAEARDEHAIMQASKEKLSPPELPSISASASLARPLAHIRHGWARARAAPSSTRICAPPIIVPLAEPGGVRLLREDTRKAAVAHELTATAACRCHRAQGHA